MKPNTNYSSPKTNILSAVLSLRKALSYGYNAVLIKMNNEDCEYPIMENPNNKYFDYRDYESYSCYTTTYNKILNDSSMSDIEKELSLNYSLFFGLKESVEKYKSTGVLSKDNFLGMGVAHIIKVDDVIKFHESIGDTRYANLFKAHYKDESTRDGKHFFHFFNLKGAKNRTPKKFKHKLWVVALLGKSERVKTPIIIKILNAIINPVMYVLKFIPKKSVLRMPQYTLYTFRTGSVVNGYKIEFQIPKKFSFK